jgi:chromate transport protein ChrA
MEGLSYAILFLSFLHLGAGAFGGPAMVEYIEEMTVKKYLWLDSKTFKDGVSLCQAIPGATAMQVGGICGFVNKRGHGFAILVCGLWASSLLPHACAGSSL